MPSTPASPLQYLYSSAAVHAAQLRAADAQAAPLDWMARAGLAAWRELLAHWPQAQRIVVACGPGGNGGDGYVLARHALAAGRRVQVVHLPGAAARNAEAIAMARAYGEAGGIATVFDGVLPAADVIVDALFGIGLSRKPDDAAAGLIAAINDCGVPVLSIDVPSGVDADSGAVPGAAIHASRTLQCIARHRGLATGAALDHVGVLALATLDLDDDVLQPGAADARLLSAADSSFGSTQRRRDSHKGSSGHVLCIGGDHGSGGAIALCAEAALRCGSGLASVATRPAHVAALLARRPELMVHGIDDASALAGIVARASVIAIGPGLGVDAWGQSLLDAAIASGKPLVIDADGLNLLARTAHALPAGTVLTPHPGEAGRLLGIDTGAVQRDRLAAARALVERFGCVVVLKGAGTIVAAIDGMPQVLDAGNPGMAVGGMGDLLTGVIAALRAQGLAAFDAAAQGALLHATAGDRAAMDGGQRGLLPADLFVHLRSLANGLPSRRGQPMASAP